MFNRKKIPSSSSRILIVDDNPKNLQLLGKELQENNYEIEFSTSGNAALEWLKNSKFDLILLDIHMPDLNGFEVCRIIREDPKMNNVPVIFLSASVERESILKGFELGAQDYITKPFDRRELLVRVRTHLKLKESLEELEKFNKTLEEKITERTLQLKESNEKLELSNLKLIDLNKAKADFLALISHEIRTPLNGILGPLNLIKGYEYESISNLVKVLDISVKRLERFSLDALLITGIQTKLIELKAENIRLSEIVNELIEEEQDLFNAANIRVERNTGLSRGIIKGDSNLIKKCILNIITNAVRFSPENGIIRIDQYSDENTISIEIKDNGEGFSNTSFEHAFEFFTTDEVYKDNSLGLGLPVSKMIMEFHGGSISIGNNPEGGAKVKLNFKKSMNFQSKETSEILII